MRPRVWQDWTRCSASARIEWMFLMTLQRRNTAVDFDGDRHCRGTAVTGVRVTQQEMSDGRTSEACDSSRPR